MEDDKTRRVDNFKTRKQAKPRGYQHTPERSQKPTSQPRQIDPTPTDRLNKRDPVESIIFEKSTTTDYSVDLSSRTNDFALIENAFEVTDKLAEGGQGEILKAKDRFLNRTVALKNLKLSTDRDLTNKRVFIEEAKLTAQLDHPAIIPVYSVNTYQRQSPCFSMKLVSGKTLASYLKETIRLYTQQGVEKFNERMSLATRLEYFLKICDAITYSHNKNVVHRDLKPDNIMIGQFHEVYVMDWGIAGIIPASDGTPLSQSSLDRDSDTLFGSAGFIDPASVKNAEPHAQMDIYALGIILYEIVTLRRGFIGDTREGILMNALDGKYPPVKHRCPGVRIELDLVAIIEKTRTPNRECRYTAVHQLSSDIRRYLSNHEVSCRPDNLPRKILRIIQRNLTLTMSFVVVLILILSGSTTYNLIKRNHEIRAAKIRELALVEYQATVARQAHRLDSQFQHIAHLLSRISDKIDQAVRFSTQTPIGDTASTNPIFSSYQYDDTKNLPPGTVHAPAYRKRINLDHPVYKLAPGIPLNSVQPQIEALFNLRSEFLSMYLSSSFRFRQDTINSLKDQAVSNGLPVTWVYAGFEKGYLVSFPGKGGYPESYDPRLRPWYKENKSKMGIQWGTPYYDINGLGIVLPCTHTLYDSENQAYGVAAIDITLDYLVSELMTRKVEGADHIREKTVIDAQGRVLISTRLQDINRRETTLINESVELKKYPDKDLFKQILIRQRGQVIKDYGPRKFIYAFALIPSLDWYYLEKIQFQDLLEHGNDSHE